MSIVKPQWYKFTQDVSDSRGKSAPWPDNEGECEECVAGLRIRQEACLLLLLQVLPSEYAIQVLLQGVNFLTTRIVTVANKKWTDGHLLDACSDPLAPSAHLYRSQLQLWPIYVSLISGRARR